MEKGFAERKFDAVSVNILHAVFVALIFEDV